MITNPKHGWCSLKIGDFEGRGSYLTEVPLDLVNAFINYYTTGAGACFIDEEGTDFTICLSNSEVYIISNRKKAELHKINISIDSLAEELQDDINRCPEQWVKEFLMLDTYGENNDRLQSFYNTVVNKRKVYLLNQVENLRIAKNNYHTIKEMVKQEMENIER